MLDGVLIGDWFFVYFIDLRFLYVWLVMGVVLIDFLILFFKVNIGGGGGFIFLMFLCYNVVIVVICFGVLRFLWDVGVLVIGVVDKFW